MQYQISPTDLSGLLKIKAQQVLANPYEINQICEDMLRDLPQFVSQSSRAYNYTNKNNITMPVAVVTTVLEQLLAQISDNSTDINNHPQILIGFNLLRMITVSTFRQQQRVNSYSTVDSNNDNKLMELICVFYANYISSIINSLQKLTASQQQSQTSQELINQMITYGLIISELVLFKMSASGTKKKMINMIPQIFRFIAQTLQIIKNTPIIQTSTKILLYRQKQIIQQQEQQEQQIDNQNLQNNVKIIKDVLIGKYNFTSNNKIQQKKINQVTTQQPLRISELLLLIQLYQSKNVKGQLYLQILGNRVSQLYLSIMNYCKHIGIKQRIIYSAGVSEYITQTISELLIVFQNAAIDSNNNNKDKDKKVKKSKKNKNKQIYLGHNNQTQVNIDQWQLIDVNIIENYTKIQSKWTSYNTGNQDEDQSQENFGEEIEVKTKQLTPRMYHEEQSQKLSLLRRKKKKLIKKIESDIRNKTINIVQEQKVREDVRKLKAKKSHNKEMFIMEKQTSEAKKFHNKAKRIKKMDKGGKKGNNNKGGSGKGGKNRGNKK